MESWLKISLLLCTFGFLKELRPSEPFLNDFLVGEWRNVTQEEITREVYPVATYAYLAQSIIVLIITDFLRYKPLIILSGMAGIVIWCLLLWTESVAALQLVEVVYGTYMATEVAYYTYIYAKVDREHFSIVTSHTRAAIWSGKFIAAVIAQVLVYNDWMDYRELNFLSLGAQICATVWALFLPSVKTSIYFNRKNNVDMLDEKPDECVGAINTDVQKSKSIKVELENAFKLLFSHCITAYSNKKVLVWSLWYAFALGGYLQVISYIQGLWSSIDDTREAVWNGGVEATLTLTGAVVALLAGYLHGGQLTQRTILWALGFLSMVEGAALFIGARTTNLWIAYSGYLIYGILYSFTITVASAEVAKNVSDDSFGLIFGINTAIALAAQCILTLSVVSYGFQLDFVEQFTVYGCYYMTLGGVYFIVLIIHYIRKL